MADSLLTSSITALRTKIINDIASASVKELVHLARSAKALGLTEDTSVESAINTRANALTSGATVEEIKDLAQAVKQVKNDVAGSTISSADDIIDGVQKAIILSKNKKSSKHRIYNLGNNSPVVLNTMIKLLEDTIGKKAKKKLVSMQPGDVKKTFADIEKSRKELNFKPKTSLRQGLLKFVNWYKEYHKI